MNKFDIRIPEFSREPKREYMLPVGAWGFYSPQPKKPSRVQFDWSKMVIGGLLALVVILGVMLVQHKPKPILPKDNVFQSVDEPRPCVTPNCN